ncbi:phage terminase small subunit P27 family [Clostridium saudiense]|uniref:Phage terminase small subunit P27 family n=1 Tax=Clostridium saudiense TaxID=1414720 RepID=A0ABS2FHB2_9CLOT|nr:phage terminase small subunit P27 family [Clostridium saudiense]MBM6819958.1 phage terminase small subunit P27 family [Clostridium saudiense]
MAKASKPVSLMTKNLTKEEKEARLEAESKLKGNADLVYEAPTDLVKEEKEVYLFLVNELRELDIINNLDIELLKLASNSIVELKKARVNVRKYGQLIQKPDGSLVKNPAITILRDYEAIFNRCCRELCLSPQSRMALSKMMADIQANSEDELLKILSE